MEFATFFNKYAHIFISCFTIYLKTAIDAFKTGCEALLLTEFIIKVYDYYQSEILTIVTARRLNE